MISDIVPQLPVAEIAALRQTLAVPANIDDLRTLLSQDTATIWAADDKTAAPRDPATTITFAQIMQNYVPAILTVCMPLLFGPNPIAKYDAEANNEFAKRVDVGWFQQNVQRCGALVGPTNNLPVYPPPPAPAQAPAQAPQLHDQSQPHEPPAVLQPAPPAQPLPAPQLGVVVETRSQNDPINKAFAKDGNIQIAYDTIKLIAGE